MINLPADKLRDGIYYLSPPADYKIKEDLYLKVRQKEDRIYDDDTLKLLPLILRNHPHYNEWQLRKITAAKLVKNFSKYSGLNILDIGAGNCWLSNIISEKTENNVFAIDLNETELRRGARVFNNNKRLKFIYGSIFENIFDQQQFDVVLFTSSIQYFPDLIKTINRVFDFLKSEGYIIIADSNFYNDEDIAAAKMRTENYYKELGFAEAAENYYHHSYNELFKFNSEVIDNNSLLTKVLALTGSPFPFIKIKRK